MSIGYVVFRVLGALRVRLTRWWRSVHHKRLAYAMLILFPWSLLTPVAKTIAISF